MIQILVRFLIGGAVVSGFAIVGDLLKPNSFAGLFGAASSVALATFGLTVATEGASYASAEAHSMTAGGIAFTAYASCVSWINDALQTESSLGHDLLNSSVVGGSIRALVRLVEIAMQIKVDPSVIGQTKWYEYAIRFLFGGLITAVAGIIAKKCGPRIGGLFLAFPTIFPASATLIEKHETQKKSGGRARGNAAWKKVARVDAVGSAMGSVGLLVFAWIVWQFAAHYRTWMVLMGATVAWLTIPVLIWHVRKQV